MEQLRERFFGLHPYLISSVAAVLTVAQIILAIVLHGDAPDAVEWIGWIALWSAGVFGMLPMFIFRRRGGVSAGDSYVKTTSLVNTGLYAVVRHPQNGTAWLLICLGVMLLAWHWSSVLLGGISMILAYADTFKADQRCIAKFGEPYRDYIERVPRVNVLAGLWRVLRERL